MNKQIIIDGISGLILFSLLSYLTDKNKNTSYFLKLTGFIWGAPFTYFYLQYIASKQGKKQLLNFNKHALFGSLCTIFLICSSMYFRNISTKQNILYSFIFTVLLAFVYGYFKVYNKF